jgi:hypothetical protein
MDKMIRNNHTEGVVIQPGNPALQLVFMSLDQLVRMPQSLVNFVEMT